MLKGNDALTNGSENALFFVLEVIDSVIIRVHDSHSLGHNLLSSRGASNELCSLVACALFPNTHS